MDPYAQADAYAAALRRDAYHRQQYSAAMSYSLSGGSASSSSSYESATIDPRQLYTEPEPPLSPTYGAHGVAAFPQAPVGSRQRRIPTQATQHPAAVSSSSKPRLPCLHFGCKSNPFSRKTDLMRHCGTVHGEPYLDCPVALSMSGQCPRMGERGFKRSDHFVEHLRDVHGINIPKKTRRSG